MPISVTSDECSSRKNEDGVINIFYHMSEIFAVYCLLTIINSNSSYDNRTVPRNILKTSWSSLSNQPPHPRFLFKTMACKLSCCLGVLKVVKKSYSVVRREQGSRGLSGMTAPVTDKRQTPHDVFLILNFNYCFIK